MKQIIQKCKSNKFTNIIMGYLGITLLFAVGAWLVNRKSESSPAFVFLFLAMLIWPFYVFQYIDSRWASLVTWWQGLGAEKGAE